MQDDRIERRQESIKTHQALARSESYSRALEARIRVLETQAYRHEWQRQDADDHAIEHIIRTHALEAGARVDTLKDIGVTAALATRDANTNGVDSHNSGTCARRNERATREFTYPYFMNCSVENQIKFSTCTLLGNALMWWNSYVRTFGNDIAYAMTWTKLKKKITNKYCPRTEINKLEVELWELKVKGTDIEKYVGGLPDMIHGSVVASKPKTMQEATEMAIEVMDKRIRTFADRQTENKRKPDNNPTTPPKQSRHWQAKVYAVGHAGINPDSNVVIGTVTTKGTKDKSKEKHLRITNPFRDCPVYSLRTLPIFSNSDKWNFQID
ncbi:reverse transcriptase domain-containing protein [Tanacetum coccineum]